MRKKLNKKLCMDDIYEICILTHGNNRKKAHLYQLTFDEIITVPKFVRVVDNVNCAVAHCNGIAMKIKTNKARSKFDF